MIHRQWSDLIPFYVAGTLPYDEAAALERHLAGCESCRRALEEWRAVAGTVRAEAETWARSTPPLAENVRDSLHAVPRSGPGPSANGYGQVPPAVQMARGRAVRRSRLAWRLPQVRVPLTLVAPLLVGCLVGAALLIGAGRGDDYASELAPPTLTPLPSLVGTAMSLTPTLAEEGASPTLTLSVPPTSADSGDLGILPTRTPLPTASARPASRTPLLPSATFPGRTPLPPTGTVPWVPTPTARFDDRLGAVGYSLITLQAVGPIPANTRVRIDYAWFDGSTWHYGVMAESGQFAEARESELAYAPGVTPVYLTPTPTAEFGQFIGLGGYGLIVTQAVGSLPANTRVRISHAWYDGGGWVYGVVAEDEQRTAEAREGQLAYAPGVTPGTATPRPLVPTPTGVFDRDLRSGAYSLIVVEQVGNIPANARVRITYAYYNGIEWIYGVVALENAQWSAEARESQLARAPDAPAATVTPLPPVLPTPTAEFGQFIGLGGYNLIVTQAVGSLPANTRVRISHAWYDGGGWVYVVVAEDEQRTAEVRGSSLAYAPAPTAVLLTPTLLVTPTPTPTPGTG